MQRTLVGEKPYYLSPTYHILILLCLARISIVARHWRGCADFSVILQAASLASIKHLRASPSLRFTDQGVAVQATDVNQFHITHTTPLNILPFFSPTSASFFNPYFRFSRLTFVSSSSPAHFLSSTEGQHKRRRRLFPVETYRKLVFFALSALHSAPAPAHQSDTSEKFASPAVSRRPPSHTQGPKLNLSTHSLSYDVTTYSSSRPCPPCGQPTLDKHTRCLLDKQPESQLPNVVIVRDRQ